jgi:predicted nucleic acid-binding Zn ribbon protein
VRHRSGDGPRRVRDSMPRLLGRLGAPPTEVLEIVFTRWDEVVTGDLGAHLRPLRVDRQALVVAADHPVWATRARLESSDILARIHALGTSPIERLEVVIERP